MVSLTIHTESVELGGQGSQDGYRSIAEREDPDRQVTRSFDDAFDDRHAVVISSRLDNVVAGDAPDEPGRVVQRVVTQPA